MKIPSEKTAPNSKRATVRRLPARTPTEKKAAVAAAARAAGTGAMWDLGDFPISQWGPHPVVLSNNMMIAMNNNGSRNNTMIISQ